jgi:hypothetical protein
MPSSQRGPGDRRGLRSNIGWFNPNPVPVDVVLRGWDTSGALLGQIEHTAGAF